VSGEACAVHSGGDKCWTYATAVHSRGVYFKNHFLYFDTHSYACPMLFWPSLPCFHVYCQLCYILGAFAHHSRRSPIHYLRLTLQISRTNYRRWQI